MGFRLGFVTASLAWIAISCGVKAPPLPPLPVTPQQSELVPGAQPSPQQALPAIGTKSTGGMGNAPVGAQP